MDYTLSFSVYFQERIISLLSCKTFGLGYTKWNFRNLRVQSESEPDSVQLLELLAELLELPEWLECLCFAGFLFVLALLMPFNFVTIPREDLKQRRYNMTPHWSEYQAFLRVYWRGDCTILRGWGRAVFRGGGGSGRGWKGEKRVVSLPAWEKSFLTKKEYANCVDRPIKHAMDC